MPHLSPRRARIATFASAAALAAVFAVPTIASADIGGTNVDSPAENTVFDSTGDFVGVGGLTFGAQTTVVTGSAPGAADGDQVDIVCSISQDGSVQLLALNEDPVTVEGGRFTATVRRPPFTCRIRAVPTSSQSGGTNDLPASTDLSQWTGPRVLGGVFGSQTVAGSDTPADGSQIYFGTRGQARGLAEFAGLSLSAGSSSGDEPTPSGGLLISGLVDDTAYRLLFGPSGLIGGFGGLGSGGVPSDDVADAGVLVDGQPAFVTGTVGDEHSVIVSRTLDPTTGDQTIVESAPIALVPTQDDRRRSSDLVSAGLTIQRTFVQDHEGEQFTYTDVFRSTDAQPHHLEVRYAESTAAAFTGDDDSTVEPASFRVPWSTGDDYVVPVAGDSFGAAPAGPATIYLHGPRQDFSDDAPPARASTRADALPPRGEGAYTFDAAPTDGRFLSPDSFAVRFVRDVPAGGSTSIKTSLSQDPTLDGLGGLVNDALGIEPPVTTPSPAAPLPATTSLPTQPVPVPVALNPLPKVATAAHRLLLTKRQGAALRDRKPVILTVQGVPAGRYGVTIRRYVANGRTIADGTKTTTKTSDVRVPLKLTSYGRTYFGLKAIRARRSVKVRIELTYTPQDGLRRIAKHIYTVKFR